MDIKKKNAIMDLLYDIQRNTNDYTKIEELVQDFVWDGIMGPTIESVKKLNIIDNSVVVLTVSDAFIKRPDLRKWLDDISQKITDCTGADDVLVIMITDMEDLEELDEDDMELYGWGRI